METIDNLKQKKLYIICNKEKSGSSSTLVPHILACCLKFFNPKKQNQNKERA